MLLKYFYDKKLAQASYMVGCAQTGEALIIDPARSIQQYQEAAQAEGLKITTIAETHIHADFVSGSRELSAATGAHMYLSDMGGEDWKYSFADDPKVILVGEGDYWMVGNVRVDVLHTPGHTPEHICFMITDTAMADKPMGIFTGDFLFVGDVGRPDLLEEAAGMVGTKEAGARDQFKSIARFKKLPDYLQIWPGHGAGSACGKALGATPSTTLGYEKMFNPAFQYQNEAAFKTWLLDGQPEAPRYFARMKHVNKVGPALLKETLNPRHLDRAALDVAIENNHLVLDMRPSEEFSEAYVPGTINVPNIGGGCVNYVGWFVDYGDPVYVIAHTADIDAVLSALKAIGVDNIGGYFTPDVVTAGETASLPVINAVQLSMQLQQGVAIVLDVRGESEYKEKHISGAQHIPLGFIPRQLDAIPKNTTIVTQCASGYRSQIAASLLRRYGFENVANLTDSKDIWEKTLPVEAY